MDLLTRLYLIRHGEVEKAYHKVFGGRIDMELSPLGHEQVRAIARFLRAAPPDVMYASPMRRVQQTLAPLAEETGLKPILLEGLREVDFGAWTGLSWDEVLQKHGVSAYSWLHQLDEGTIERAETVPEFRKRVEISLDQILAEAPGKTVAVICHGGVIRMLLSILLDLPFRKMSIFEIEYASVTKIHHRPSKREIEFLNLTPWRDYPSEK
ncbi:MAG TPA: histidine phosphatase family protein [Verrucomicrobiae bacterium]|nr:histidine phosphatase family protein [Verrucomicrobiae bacterium]